MTRLRSTSLLVALCGGVALAACDASIGPQGGTGGDPGTGAAGSGNGGSGNGGSGNAGGAGAIPAPSGASASAHRASVSIWTAVRPRAFLNWPYCGSAYHGGISCDAVSCLMFRAKRFACS